MRRFAGVAVTRDAHRTSVFYVELVSDSPVVKEESYFLPRRAGRRKPARASRFAMNDFITHTKRLGSATQLFSLVPRRGFKTNVLVQEQEKWPVA